MATVEEREHKELDEEFVLHMFNFRWKFSPTEEVAETSHLCFSAAGAEVVRIGPATVARR